MIELQDTKKISNNRMLPDFIAVNLILAYT